MVESQTCEVTSGIYFEGVKSCRGTVIDFGKICSIRYGYFSCCTRKMQTKNVGKFSLPFCLMVIGNELLELIMMNLVGIKGKAIPVTGRGGP
jgi:hypothetical protein